MANSNPCPFCAVRARYIDYKDFPTLGKYVSRYGKIRARYYSGVCLQHQKSLGKAIKNARIMGLMPYIK